MHQRSILLFLALMSALTIAVIFSGEIGVQIPKVTGVTAGVGIGVYWDSSATNSCSSISWGQLAPGARKTVVLYLKNEGTDSIYYSLTTEHWYPIVASNYMILQWDYNGARATSGSVWRISLTLLVSSRIQGIVDFSFDIIITGSPYPLGDINNDLKVDGRDIALVGQAFGSEPGSSTWNSIADLNQDEKIDGKDSAIISQNFGKTFV